MAHAQYRVCMMDVEGNLIDIQDLKSNSDTLAIEAAKDFLGFLDLEVWCGDRLVARLMGGPPLPSREPDKARAGLRHLPWREGG